MEDKWYKHSYRRHLLDMHYEDWDPAFLSKFDPKTHVEMLKRAHVKSAVIFTNSHVGWTYWPSSRVPMHRGIQGRDIVGESVALYREAGIDPILYVSYVYDNWAYAAHPEWRILDAAGKPSREWAEGHRYGLCCPNSGYKAFAVAHTEELCARYDAASLHPDMLFWNGVCFCPACKERFSRETGLDLPEAIDWRDPRWVAYNQKREEWMTEFADAVCASARRARPGITVSIQSSGVFSAWPRGVNETEIRGSDYSYGDLYGGVHEESFACKFYHEYSPNLPFQYETNFCDIDWTEHAIRKPPELMELQAFTALAHGGAFLFIDPIDPEGLHQNPKIFDEMGKIFSKAEKVEPWLGGSLAADVGVYFSQRSKFSPEENGMALTAPARRMPHLEAAAGAASALAEAHIPFGVANRTRLAGIGKYQVLVLPDVLVLDDGEAEAIRAYVASGGCLLASGRTFHPALADVFGVQPEGETKETVTYVNEARPGLLPQTFSGYPLTIRGRQVTARPQNPCDVLAVVNLPPTDPSDRSSFVSIHSNPPGRDTEHPAVVRHAYGKGTVIWTSVAFEAMPYEPHRMLFLGLVRKLLTGKPSFECDAPAQVEVVLTRDAQKRHCLVSVLNMQDKMPPLPVFGFTVKVNLNGETAKSVERLPQGEPAEYTERDGYVEFRIDRLDLWAMFVVKY